MKVKVFIKDALTEQVIRDNEVTTPEFNFQQMSLFHSQFENKFPNAHVNFSWQPKGYPTKSFICGVPKNMKADEAKIDSGVISYEDYMAKWYKQQLA